MFGREHHFADVQKCVGPQKFSIFTFFFSIRFQNFFPAAELQTLPQPPPATAAAAAVAVAEAVAAATAAAAGTLSTPS